MAFNFGAPAATPASGFNFGAASTPATPQFGASNPVFGAAASAPAFNFSGASAAAPSAPASTSSLFGSFSTPALGAASAPAFGAASSSAFPFGGASTPAFGAASTPAFGAAASTPGAFGFGAASTPAFGASSAAFSFPTSTPAFGAASTPAFGGFGQATASTSAFATPSFFGSAQPQGQLQTQLAPVSFASGLPPQPDLAAIKEVEAIREAYTAVQANPRNRFSHLFLNVVDNPASRVKPPGVDELKWREALQKAGGANNANRLWPVQALGPKDLLARKEAQVAAIREHKERLAAAAQAVRQLARKQDTMLKERIEQVRRRHRELGATLLRVMRRVDLLEGRFAAANGYWSGQQQRGAAADLARQLAALEATIAPAASGGLEERVESLAVAARMQAGAPPAARADLAGGQARLDGASLERMFGVLAGHAEALARLQDVLRRDDRDLAILGAARDGGVADMALVPSF